MTEELKPIDPDYYERYRRAIAKAPYVLFPHGQRAFMVMWRWADQFGVRNRESGEQYAFTYEDAIRQGLAPMVLCLVDVNAIPL